MKLQAFWRDLCAELVLIFRDLSYAYSTRTSFSPSLVAPPPIAADEEKGAHPAEFGLGNSPLAEAPPQGVSRPDFSSPSAPASTAPSAEGQARSGVAGPGLSPHPGETPRRGVPRNLVRARDLLGLIAGDQCWRVRDGLRCRENPDLSPYNTGYWDRWCSSCLGSAALDALAEVQR